MYYCEYCRQASGPFAEHCRAYMEGGGHRRQVDREKKKQVRSQLTTNQLSFADNPVNQ